MSHFGIARKPAHDLKRSDSVFFSNRDLRLQPRVDETFANYICKIKHIVLGVLQGPLSLGRFRQERTGRFVVCLMRFDGHDLALGIAQRCELATEDTACINVDRVVEEERLGNGRVSIDHQSLAAIVRCPVITNGQAKLVRLSGCLTKEGEFPHCS